MMRVAIVGSPDKDAVRDTLARTRNWLADRAEVVFAELTYDATKVVDAQPDLLVVLGGDGTLIAAIHCLGQHQVPIVGINLGKLGFLAEFTIDQLESEGGFLFNGDPPVTRRVMLEVAIEHADGPGFHTFAVNDCVILAGPPFRMIETAVEADGDNVARVRGDGLIVATASGSTAHNLSAGGPILEPTAEAFILTPICPHALTYRSLVMSSDRRIRIQVTQANEGTTAAIDGHVCRPLHLGDRIVISRYSADFLLVRNPQYSAWRALRRKLMWGEQPTIS